MIAVYGLLQAMIVQQDAIGHLEEAIEIKKPNLDKEYPGLLKIRKIRVETVGHPTSTRLKDGYTSYTSISHTSNPNILEYAVWSKKGFEHKSIDLKEIITTQHELLTKEIDRIMKKITEDEKTHRKTFKANSLSDLLKSTNYHIEKLWSFERSREYSRVNFETLKSTYESFKEEIKKRFKIKKVDEYGVQIPGLVVVVQHIEKILPKIEKMIPMEADIDPLDLDVYVESLDKAFDDLRKMAKEIDDEFNT